MNSLKLDVAHFIIMSYAHIYTRYLFLILLIKTVNLLTYVTLSFVLFVGYARPNKRIGSCF